MADAEDTKLGLRISVSPTRLFLVFATAGQKIEDLIETVQATHKRLYARESPRYAFW